MDHVALEAAGCLVVAEPGDTVLLFPEVYHRTFYTNYLQLQMLASLHYQRSTSSIA